jgi:hypothetical protein
MSTSVKSAAYRCQQCSQIVPSGASHQCAKPQVVVRQGDLVQQQSDDIQRLVKIAEDFHNLYYKLPIAALILAGFGCVVWLSLMYK